MSFVKSFAILALFYTVILGAALPKPDASQTVRESVVAPIKLIGLKDQWTFGNCGSYVRTQDLVYYDHVSIQANSASSSLTDTVSWVGTKSIYCIELTGNQGTQLRVQKGGIGYTSVSVYGASAVGKDLEGIVYVYAS